MAKGEVGNGSLTEQISSGQSVNDWTTGTQSETSLTTGEFTVIIPSLK